MVQAQSTHCTCELEGNCLKVWFSSSWATLVWLPVLLIFERKIHRLGVFPLITGQARAWYRVVVTSAKFPDLKTIKWPWLEHTSSDNGFALCSALIILRIQQLLAPRYHDFHEFKNRLLHFLIRKAHHQFFKKKQSIFWVTEFVVSLSCIKHSHIAWLLYWSELLCYRKFFGLFRSIHSQVPHKIHLKIQRYGIKFNMHEFLPKCFCFHNKDTCGQLNFLLCKKDKFSTMSLKTSKLELGHGNFEPVIIESCATWRWIRRNNCTNICQIVDDSIKWFDFVFTNESLHNSNRRSWFTNRQIACYSLLKLICVYWTRNYIFPFTDCTWRMIWYE